MKTQIMLLRITGSICILFLLFHCAFQKLFDWNNTLACLSQSNRAIMLTYHYVSILLLAFMTFVLLIQPHTLLSGGMKYSVLGLFIANSGVRVVTEFTLFGFSGLHSWIILLMCFVPMVLLAFPLLKNTRENEK
jgi:hypothetical protein